MGETVQVLVAIVLLALLVEGTFLYLFHSSQMKDNLRWGEEDERFSQANNDFFRTK